MNKQHQGLKDFNWFDDSEIATSSLYSESLALNTDDSDSAENSEPILQTAEAEIPLTNTITIGNPERTQFTFNFAEYTPQEVIDGVREAARIWSSFLLDDVDLQFDFTFTPGEPNVLGSTNSSFITFTYTDINQALAADVTSANDETAVTHFPEGSVPFLINNTSENNGSDTPYLDNNGGLNNSRIRLTTANAKALGFSSEYIAEALGVTPEEVVDANINFSSNINWDFDRSDGIASDATDFLGTVFHEIGHALGFVSTADVLDQNDVSVNEDGLNLDKITSENVYIPSSLDLFRFSPESFSQGVRDFTTGNIGGKYFSIDGGQTSIAPLAEGGGTAIDLGGRNQLSHWRDDLGIGILDPTGAPGELQNVTDTDLLAFDVIGWDLA